MKLPSRLLCTVGVRSRDWTLLYLHGEIIHTLCVKFGKDAGALNSLLLVCDCISVAGTYTQNQSHDRTNSTTAFQDRGQLGNP